MSSSKYYNYPRKKNIKQYKTERNGGKSAVSYYIRSYLLLVNDISNNAVNIFYFIFAPHLSQ